MCSTASILNLCLISLDRYIRIKDPLQYTQWITRTSVPILVCLVWTTSALISFLPIMMDLHISQENHTTNTFGVSDKETIRIILGRGLLIQIPRHLPLAKYVSKYTRQGPNQTLPSENRVFSTAEHPVYPRPVCKLKFVRCGPVEKKQSVLSVSV